MKEQTEDPRNLLQQEAIYAWWENLSEPPPDLINRTRDDVSRIGRIELGTGLGKSKIAAEILKLLLAEFNHGREIVILVPQERLKEHDWPNELMKFGIELTPRYGVPNQYWIDERRNLGLEIACYQGWSMEGGTKTLLIMDEFDFCLTPEYSKPFIPNRHYRNILALTAFVPDHKKELANQIAPLVFNYSTQEAQNAGLLNKTKFYFVNFPLSYAKSIPVKMRTGKVFYTSEVANYNYLEEQFHKAIIDKSVAERKAFTASILDEPSVEFEKTADRAEKRRELFSRKRKEFLHELTSSRKVTKVLIDEILKKDKSKVLVFSKLTKQIDQICEHTYHSKNKTGNQNIARLNMGEIRVLGVCDALNRGANLIGVDHIIEESYHSSETDFQQRHGRGVRLPINETLHFIILIPWTEVREEETTNGVKRLVWKKKPTQAAKWVENMSQRFDLGEVVTIDMKYDSRTDSYRLP